MLVNSGATVCLGFGLGEGQKGGVGIEADSGGEDGDARTDDLVGIDDIDVAARADDADVDVG